MVENVSLVFRQFHKSLFREQDAAFDVGDGRDERGPGALVERDLSPQTGPPLPAPHRRTR